MGKWYARSQRRAGWAPRWPDATSMASENHPVLQSNTLPDMKTSPPASAAKTTGAAEQDPPNPTAHILVVEDDVYVRQLHTEVLERSGYRVDTAEDGAAAWEALQAANYDLLITDNNMPNLTGVDLVKKMRNQEMSIPVIMATGAMPSEEFERTPALKIAATLLKPFASAELVAVVKKILRLSVEDHQRIGPQRS